MNNDLYSHAISGDVQTYDEWKVDSSDWFDMNEDDEKIPYGVEVAIERGYLIAVDEDD